jgi:hypothetical protein
MGRLSKLAIPETCEGSSGLEKVLGLDYRLSFKFSQGSAKLQEILFCLLGAKYSQRYGQEHAASLLAITTWPNLSMPPKSHRDVDQKHIERESAAEFEKFCHYITHPDLHYLTDDPEMYADLMAAATDLVLARDLKYVDEHSILVSTDRTAGHAYFIPHPSLNGRPHRPEPIRYSSFFKKYVVDERPTGSDAFNVIFQDMRAHALAYPSPLIDRLADAWEPRHPGKDFYGPDFYPKMRAS